MKIALSACALAMGRGGGRGMSAGRGTGRGRGRLSGMGQGQGRRYGTGGRGMGRSSGGFIVRQPASNEKRTADNELVELNQKVDTLNQQNRHLQHGMRESTMRQRLVTNIDKETCTGCGACADACVCGAIQIENGIARVSEEDCIGCGVCVGECPLGAIEMA
jgi:ferredoxin